MKVKIVTGTAQSANNIKRKNKQINNDKKKIAATNHNLRLSMQTTEKRSDDVTKTKFGLVGHIQKKKKMKNVQLPNISTLLQIGEEI